MFSCKSILPQGSVRIIRHTIPTRSSTKTSINPDLQYYSSLQIQCNTKKSTLGNNIEKGKLQKLHNGRSDDTNIFNLQTNDTRWTARFSNKIGKWTFKKLWCRPWYRLLAKQNTIQKRRANTQVLTVCKNENNTIQPQSSNQPVNAGNKQEVQTTGGRRRQTRKTLNPYRWVQATNTIQTHSSNPQVNTGNNRSSASCYGPFYITGYGYQTEKQRSTI